MKVVRDKYAPEIAYADLREHEPLNSARALEQASRLGAQYVEVYAPTQTGMHWSMTLRVADGATLRTHRA